MKMRAGARDVAWSDAQPKFGEDEHLRSAREVRGYRIEARDGEIGHADDFIVGDRSWRIHCVVVDTARILPGHKVLVPIDVFQSVSWANRTMAVSLDAEQIRASPRFDPHAPINREIEVRLYDYYGRPKGLANSETSNGRAARREDPPARPPHRARDIR